MMGQIERYVPIMLACGATEEEALDDMICRKILRKLEQLSPAFVRNEADRLLDVLSELFGENSLAQTREYIVRLKRTV